MLRSLSMRNFAVVDERTMWPPDGRRTLAEITDDPSETIVVLEAPRQGVHWAKPEDLIIIVTGGAGKHSQWVPTFGNTRAATRALKREDGELVKSIHELKRG